MKTDHEGQGRTRHSIADGVVHIVYEGRIGADDLIGAREAFLIDPDFRPGMSFISDFRKASLRELSEKDLRRVAAHGSEMAASWKRHRTAAVVAAEVDYGVSRMFAVLGERPGLELEVFRDFGIAVDWLRET
ncbi:MAG: hypothetical protein ACR2QM_13775 [Longimicrobiales bacterium]